MKPLTIKNDDDEIATTEEQQIEIITAYFKKMLAPENEPEKSYEPTDIRNPFTAKEIEKAARKMKNGKSAGPDKLEVEFIKYAPIEIHQEIANIFNTITKTGEELRELVFGLLRPLQKPGKTKGPVENLRPIILLSVIRKILTIIMLDRLWNRLKTELPTKQAAYQPGRGTTEQVHAVKLLAEKAIISNDFNIYLLLLDMSKAFDTVNRTLLFEHLEEILHADELYILHRLTNNPEISVKIGNTIGENFKTTIGIIQGDCLSAILFIYYLAMCLRLPLKTKMKSFMINPMYADDITFIGTNEHQIDEIEAKMANHLNKYNLKINAPQKQRNIKYQDHLHLNQHHQHQQNF